MGAAWVSNVDRPERVASASRYQAAGAASALNGFCMMVLAFCVGAVLGQVMTGTTLLPMVLGMWFFGAWIALVAWTLVQRHGQPAHG